MIDDARDIRVLVRRILESEGATVFEAENVEEGVKLAMEKHPRLIITDLNMPRKSGFEFLVQRKANKVLSETPTLVLTSRKDKESIVRAIGLGASGYVLKPIRTIMLLAKVRAMIKADPSLRRSRRFDPAARPKATVLLPAEVSKISEAGLQISCAVKLSGDQNVRVQADLLNRLDCADVVTRTTRNPSKYIEKARYQCELVFLGVTDLLAKSIRTRLKAWR